MFTEINLTINADVKTSTGGTVNGAKLKIEGMNQGITHNMYTVGGCIHENADAEHSEDCESIKVLGLNMVEKQKNPANPSHPARVVYYDYFGLNIPVTGFGDIDTEEKRIALIKTALVNKLNVIEGVTVAVEDIV